MASHISSVHVNDAENILALSQKSKLHLPERNVPGKAGHVSKSREVLTCTNTLQMVSGNITNRNKEFLKQSKVKHNVVDEIIQEPEVYPEIEQVGRRIDYVDDYADIFDYNERLQTEALDYIVTYRICPLEALNCGGFTDVASHSEPLEPETFPLWSDLVLPSELLNLGLESELDLDTSEPLLPDFEESYFLGHRTVADVALHGTSLY